MSRNHTVDVVIYKGGLDLLCCKCEVVVGEAQSCGNGECHADQSVHGSSRVGAEVNVREAQIGGDGNCQAGKDLDGSSGRCGAGPGDRGEDDAASVGTQVSWSYGLRCLHMAAQHAGKLALGPLAVPHPYAYPHTHSRSRSTHTVLIPNADTMPMCILTLT